jgi:hypothetical protein
MPPLNRAKKQSEKATEKYLTQEIRKVGGDASKWVCPEHWGKPDRICEFPSGLVVFVEVKSEGDKPKEHQLREHERMRGRLMLVEVVSTKEEVDTLIKKYKVVDVYYRIGDKYDPT